MLIYPKTETFNKALPVFAFPKSSGLRVWVLPFCLQRRHLILPACGSLDGYFSRGLSALEGRNAASDAVAQEAVLA